MSLPSHQLSWDPSLSKALSHTGVVCWWKRYPDGYHRALAHQHVGIEVIFCESGDGAMRIGDIDYMIVPGTVVLFPASLPHTPLMNRNYERWNLCFLPIYAKNHPHFTSTIFHQRIDGDTQQKVRRIFKEISAEVSVRGNETGRYVGLLIEQLLVLFQRSEVESTSRSAITSSTIANEFDPVPEVINYIESHLQEDLAVHKLAKVFNYSEGHIWRIIRSSTGRSPIDYINDRRLAKASRLLLHTDRSIAAISDMVGFGSSSYFARIFKRKMDMTPSEYRLYHTD